MQFGTGLPRCFLRFGWVLVQLNPSIFVNQTTPRRLFAHLSTPNHLITNLYVSLQLVHTLRQYVLPLARLYSYPFS